MGFLFIFLKKRLTSGCGGRSDQWSGSGSGSGSVVSGLFLAARVGQQGVDFASIWADVLIWWSDVHSAALSDCMEIGFGFNSRNDHPSGEEGR
jgi:hypothetical protein